MLKIWALRLHRWLALLCALPLLAIIASGLILSVEPGVVSTAIHTGSLPLTRVLELLQQHDPAGQARALAFRSYDRELVIGGRGGVVVDVDSGAQLAAPSVTAQVFVTARRLHETLLLDAGGLVVAATVAMTALILFGVVIGLPRIANTVDGWHKAMSWGLLPLVVLSPVTGLMLAWGVTLNSPAPTPAQRPLPLAQALAIVAQERDLATLNWLRPQGGRTLVRLVENGEYRVYAVAAQGLTPLPRNWPRLWHEGTFAGVWSALMNAVLSFALLGLLGTGCWLWLRRQLRRRAHRLRQAARRSGPAAA